MSKGYSWHKVGPVLQIGVMAAAVPFWWLVLLWHKLVAHDRAEHAWVISGHRGRLCVDNAKALF